jgi:hypothetical protein
MSRVPRAWALSRRKHFVQSIDYSTSDRRRVSLLSRVSSHGIHRYTKESYRL